MQREGGALVGMSAAPSAPVFDVLHALQLAVQHHQAGYLSEAENLYRQILQVKPNHPDALHLSGVIAQQSGNVALAEQLIAKAIRVKPSAEMYYNLGLALQGQGKLVEALASYQKALALKPDYADAHYNSGNALKEQGKLDAAARSYQRALVCRSDYVEAHINLGSVFYTQHKLDAAIDHCRQALALNADFADAHYNLANALKDQGQLDAAIESYQRALSINANFAEAHNNLAGALQEQGEFDAAIVSYRNALSIKPDYAEVHNNLGNAFKDQGKIDRAVESYQLALKFQPDLAGTWNNLGGALQTEGKLDDAINCYRRAIQNKADFIEAHSNLIFALDMADNVSIADLWDERKRWDATHAAPLVVTHRAFSNSPVPTRRLRIGYVSADFREHSAASVFGGMLVHFDRSHFEVFAYSNAKTEDAITRLFQKNVTGWRNISHETDEAAADMIRQDGIDILVDLSGHSAGNRLLVFARKPAPIQITAWGYATSTGMQAIDVFFADPVVVPPEEKEFYTEQVRYLPNVAAYYTSRIFPELSDLPGLSNPRITFGSFNRLTKVSEQAFKAWAQVLLAIPDSRMILKTSELSDPDIRDRVAAHFIDAGIDPVRITMLGKTSWSEHIAVFNQVDIALDPFPHGGGVTALEGLMMGVPVITLRWNTLVGRLSASILTTLALSDWIAETPQQYVEIALQKARDLAALKTLRETLRDRLIRSIIGDAAAYTAVVEQEYRLLWSAWCARQKEVG